MKFSRNIKDYTDEELSTENRFAGYMESENVTEDEFEIIRNRNIADMAFGFFIADGHSIERSWQMSQEINSIY